MPRLALIAVALFLVLAGVAGSQEPATVKIATIPIDAGAEVLYAQDQGFFKKEGLNATIQPISNGAAIASAVASGAINIGFSNFSSLAIAFKRGVPITVIAPAGEYLAKEPTSACVVSINSPIHTAKEMDGKTFGTNGLGNITEFAPRAWVDDNGGNSASMKFVEMTFSEMPPALNAGRIDAALMAEPALSAAKGKVRVLSDCYNAVAQNFIIAAYFTTQQWAKAHPDELKHFQAAIRDTASWANKNRPKTALMLAKWAKMKPALIQKMARAYYPIDMDPALIQPLIDVTARYAGIQKFPASELLYKSP